VVGELTLVHEAVVRCGMRLRAARGDALASVASTAARSSRKMAVAADTVCAGSPIGTLRAIQTIERPQTHRLAGAAR
jgi:hypothetical protein